MNAKILILIFGLMFTSHPGYSQWVQTGNLEGGTITSFAFIGKNIFSGSLDGGVFRSQDSGAHWTAVNNGISSPYITGFSTIGTILYASSLLGVFRSDDSGTHWVNSSYGLSNNTIKYLYNDGSFLYAISDGPFTFRSSDSGKNWIRISTPSPNKYSEDLINCLLQIDSFLYAGTHGGIYRSSDYGNNWQHISLTKNITSLILNESTIYIGTDSGEIYSSADKGLNWMSMNSPLNYTSIKGLTFIADTLIACTKKGVFKKPKGQSWFEIDSDIENTYPTTISLINNELFIGTTGSGIFSSNNMGEAWIMRNIGLTNNDVEALIFKDNIVYSGTDAGVFRSTDYGISWITSNIGLPYTRTLCFASNDSDLFVGTNGGIYRSINQGKYWDTTGMISDYIFSIAIVGKIILGAGDTKVYRSIDYGNTWTVVDSGIPPMTQIRYLKVLGSCIIAASPNSIYRSIDSGRTWQRSNTGLIDSSISSLNVNGSKVYVSTGVGLHISFDSGNTWTPFGITYYSSGNDIVFNGSTIFINAPQISYTIDSGANWNSFQSGLPQTITSKLLIANGFIFTGTKLGGWPLFDLGFGVWRRPLTDLGVAPRRLDQFLIEQNFPNPFFSHTTISFSLTRAGNISLIIFDVLGNKIATIANGYYDIGKHQVDWDTGLTPSGTYFYRLQGSDFSEMKKLIIGY